MNLADNLKKIRNNPKDSKFRIKSLEEQLQNAKDSYQEVYYEVDRFRALIINSEADITFDRNGRIIEIIVHSIEQ